jgi:hypothetical protein
MLRESRSGRGPLLLRPGAPAAHRARLQEPYTVTLSDGTAAAGDLTGRRPRSPQPQLLVQPAPTDPHTLPLFSPSQGQGSGPAAPLVENPHHKQNRRGLDAQGGDAQERAQKERYVHGISAQAPAHWRRRPPGAAEPPALLPPPPPPPAAACRGAARPRYFLRPWLPGDCSGCQCRQAGSSSRPREPCSVRRCSSTRRWLALM